MSNYNPYNYAANSQYPELPVTLGSTPDANQLVQQVQQESAQISAPYADTFRKRIEQLQETNKALGNTFSNLQSQKEQVSSNIYGSTTQERMRARTMQARANMGARLGEEQSIRERNEDLQKLQNGMSEEEVQKERNLQNELKLPENSKARIQNFENSKVNPYNTINDKELLDDIHSTPEEQIQAKYQDNPVMLNYILGQKAELKNQALGKTTYNPYKEESIFDLQNLGAATIAGLGENVGAVSDAYNMATLSGEERIKALQDGITQKSADFADSVQSQEAILSDLRNQMATQEESNVYHREYLRNQSIGVDKDTSARKAEWERTKQATKNLTNNSYQIGKEIAQGIADLGVSLLTGSGAARLATLGLKGAKELALNQFEKTMAHKIKQQALQEATQNGLKGAAKKEYIEKAVDKAKTEYMDKAVKEIEAKVATRTKLGVGASEAVNTGLQNAPQGYQTASQNILDIPLETLKNTQGFKEMKEANPELSDKEIQIKMADEAGVKGYQYAGLATAGLGALGSKFEADWLLARTKGLGSPLKLAGNTAIEGAQQGAEEGLSVGLGNVASNQQTKDKTINNFQNTGKSTVMGALSGGGSTAITSTPKALKDTITAGGEKVLEKVTDRQQQKINNQSNQAVNNTLGTLDSSNSTDPSTDNKPKFSESNFGKLYLQRMQDLSQSTEPVLKDLFKNKSDYTGNVLKLNDFAQAKLKQSQDLEAQGKTDEAKKAKEDYEDMQFILNEFGNALLNDVHQTGKYKELLNKIQIARQSGDTQAIQDALADYHTYRDNDSKYDALKQSTLFKVLDPSTRSTVDSTQPITANDILGDGNFSFTPDNIYKQTKNDIKKLKDIKKLSPEERNKALVNISHNLAKFSASLANQPPKTIQDMNKIKGQYLDLLRDTYRFARDIGNQDLLNLTKVYADFLKQPLVSGTNIKAYRETMFGGTNQGLLDYFTKAMVNGGKLLPEDELNLIKFQISQEGKLAGLRKAYAELKANPNKPVKVVNTGLYNKEGDKVMKRQDGTDAEFTSLKALEKYAQRVKREYGYFTQLGDSILGLDLNKTSTEQIPVDNNTEEVQPDTDKNVENLEDKSEEPQEEEKDVSNADTTEYADKSMALNERIVASGKHITGKVAQSFESISKQWSEKLGNELTETDEETTDTIIEVETKDGKKEIRIPMSAMVELNRKGYDPTVNLINEVLTFNATQNKEEIDTFVDNPTNKGLGENNVFGSVLTPIVKNIKRYFANSDASVLDPDYGSKLGKFHLINAMMNFVSVENKGGVTKYIIPNELKLAMAKAQAIAMVNYKDLGNGKDQQYRDYWEDDLKAVDVEFFETTQKERFGHVNKNVVKEAEITNEHELGIIRNDFVEKLGKLVIEQLGATFNRGSKYHSDDIENGIIYSLGLELYNAMLGQDLLTTHSAELTLADSSKKEIPYVNFKLNLDNESNEKDILAMEALTSSVDLEGMSLEQAKAYIKGKPLLNSIYLTNENQDTDAFKQTFNETELNTGVRISSIKERIGKEHRTQNPDKVSKSSTKNDITTTDNPELNSAIAHMNNVSYGLNVPFFRLLETNPEAVQLALGYEDGVENLPVSDATKKSIRSKNNQILRAIGLVNKFVKQAREQGLSDDDMMFQFQHEFVTNMRTMLKADLNPQSNKIVREMLRLVQTKVGSDGTIQGEIPVKIDLGGKKSKFNNDGNPRTVQQLIKVANGLRKSEARNFAIGFLLALNQGLDIGKIEKEENHIAFEKVNEALSDPNSLLSKVADIVWKMQLGQEQNNPYTLSREEQKLLKEFGSELGNGSARALNALQSWANFKYRGTNQDPLANKRGRNQFETALLLEADGIGNGLYNITRQFVTKMSQAYFNTLKRTGMVTLDILSQVSVSKFKTENQKVKFIQQMQGSAGLFKAGFSKDEFKKLSDIYEVIADKLGIEANASLKRIKDFAEQSSLDLNKLTFTEFNRKYAKQHQLPDDIKEDIKFLMQLHTSGKAKFDSENTPLASLIYKAYDNINIPLDALIEVNRNLAKAGVTPTVYGGQLSGIASQLFGDNKSEIISKFDKLIKLGREIDNDVGGLHQLHEVKKDLTNIFAVLGIELKEVENADDFISQNGYEAYLKELANINIFKLNANKKQIINSLKTGLATKLRNAVQESYIDEFAMLNFSMAQDDIAFVNFQEEFIDKIKEAVNKRNKAKGYAKNDPRNHSPLSRKEIKDIIGTITSAPVIATAFANDAQLFEDVFAMGNSLVKFGSYTLDEQTTINSAYANKWNNWSHNVTTQLFRSYRRYVAAGASNATSTIPATESKTQANLAERLMKMLSGITSLNVFDGIDGLLYFRDLLGSIANDVTNQVHLDTSVLKHFYDKFTKSGLDSVIENTRILSPKLQTILNQEKYSFKEVFKHLENEPTKEDLKYILGLITMLQMRAEYTKLTDGFGKTNEDKKFINNQLKEFNTLKSQISEQIDNLIMSKPTTKIKLNKDLFSIIDTSTVGLGNNENLTQIIPNLYDKTVYNFALSVAKNRAIKEIERKYLPVIVNQFAGGNRGYFFNAEMLNSTGKRFKNFVINKYGAEYFANTDFRISTEALVDFLQNDEIIQADYKKISQAYYNKLHKPFKQNNQVIASTDSNVQKVSSLVKDVLNKSFLSTQNKVLNLLVDIDPDVLVLTATDKKDIDSLIPKGMVQNGLTREETITKLQNNLQSVNANGKHQTLILVDKEGKTQYFSFIYLNPNRSINSFTLSHELVHHNANTMINFIVNPRYAQDIQIHNPELYKRLETFSFDLISNIQAFVTKNENLSSIQKRLEVLRNDPKQRHHYISLFENWKQLQETKIANIANYIYFFNELNENSLPEGMTQEQLYSARAGVLHELLAYSLTDFSTQNELRNHKAVTRKYFENLVGFYDKIKQSVMKFFGFTSETEKEFSMLQAILEDIYGFNKLAKEELVSDLDSNTYSLNNSEYNQMFMDYLKQTKVSKETTTNENTNFSFEPSQINIRHYSASELSKQFRNKVGSLVQTLKEKNSQGLPEYPDQLLTLLDTDTTKNVGKVLTKLRNKGYAISTNEEDDIVLAYKLNTISQEINSSASKQLSNVLKDLVDSLPNKVVTEIKNSGLDEASLAVALATLNQDINNQLNQNNNSKKTKYNDLVEKTENLFDFGGLTLDEKTLPSLQKLQLGLVSFNKNQLVSESFKQQVIDRELDKAKQLSNIQDSFNEVIARSPRPLAVILSGSADLLTGKDLLPSGQGQDSAMGQLIRKWVRNHEELYGRNTLPSKFINWMVGQDFSTQYSAKLKGEASQLNAIIRERLSTIIPASIREQFEYLDSTAENALDNVLMSSQLNRIGNLSIPLNEVLTDVSARNRAIAEAEGNISLELSNLGYSNQEIQTIQNYIKWQTEGLADWVVNQEAKGKDLDNNILPNAKVISSLQHISKVAKRANNEEHSNVLRKYVEQLVSLRSLEHHSKDDLNILSDLYIKDKKGFNYLLDSQQTLDNDMEIYGKTSYAGFDGFSMNKRNPYKDIKLLNPKTTSYTKDKERLSSLGYQVKANLNDGTEVWFTNENPSNRFTTGVFGLSEHSIRGMDVNRMTPLHGFDTEGELLNKPLDFSNHPALKDNSYYSKLTTKSSKRLLIDNDGAIVGVSTALPKRIERDLIETYENGIDAIGNVKGRITEEIATEANNQYYVDQLLNVYEEHKRKGTSNRFMLIDGNYKSKTNSKADVEFANRINNIYKSLPASTKQYIVNKGGLYIERTEIDNLLGYNQASWSDIFTGRSGLPEPVQKTIRATIGSVAQVFGLNPVFLMKRIERAISEVASLSKDFILVRSGVVAIGNMVSNIVHLWNTGVPLKQIPLLMREGFIEVRKYNRDYNRTLELRHLIQVTSNRNLKSKYQVELNALEKTLSKNPVLPLVNEGILTNIASASGVEENNPYGLINTAQTKLGFNKFKQTTIGKAWGNIMVQEGSKTHSFMNASLDYGDFVAKYALYTHLTKNRQFNSDRALNVIRDEFINYGLNRGRVFDWANKVGLTWFLSYKLGIQKILLRNLRRNFLRTATVYSGAKLIGTNQVVPAQNLLFDGSLRYQTSPSNLWDGFTTHWIGQVF